MKRQITDSNLHLELQAELYRAFNFFNKKYAKGKLKTPVVTIQSRGKQKAHGWFCHNIWSIGTNTAHEINICAESLAEGINQTVDTLLHEMAHLANYQEHSKVVDCTDQQRHNEIFKKKAEQFGLSVTSSKRFGSAHTALTEATKDIIKKELKLNETLFQQYRKTYNEAQKEKKDKEKPTKLAPVMIGTETKELVAANAKEIGCDQKELTETAIKFYLHMLKTKPTSIPKEFRIAKK